MTGLGAFIDALHLHMDVAFSSLDVHWLISVNAQQEVKASVYHGPRQGQYPHAYKTQRVWTRGASIHPIAGDVRALKREVMSKGEVELRCTCPASMQEREEHSTGCALYEAPA